MLPSEWRSVKAEVHFIQDIRVSTADSAAHLDWPTHDAGLVGACQHGSLKCKAYAELHHT
jgi:L-asparaginase II